MLNRKVRCWMISKRSVIGHATPEAGAPGCNVGTLITHNAKVHTEFSDSSGILLSYNVSATNSSDLVCANDYIPPWAGIQISGVTDVEGGGKMPAVLGNGRAGFPQAHAPQ